MIQNAISVAEGREVGEIFGWGMRENLKGPTMLSHSGKAAYDRPHSDWSQDAAASRVSVRAVEMLLIGNTRNCSQKEKKIEGKNANILNILSSSVIFLYS